jgi:hypothetical protein
MSKPYAAVSALTGMVLAGIIASPYLSRGNDCKVGEPEFTCTLNNSIAPFVGAILLGFVAGIAIGRNGQKAWQRWGPGASDRTPVQQEEAPAPAPVVEQAPPEPEPEPAPVAARDGTLGSRGRPRPTPRVRD